MTLDDRLRAYRDAHTLACDEHRMAAASLAARRALLAADAAQHLSRRQFLLCQCRLIRKRWWLAQLLLLFVLAQTLSGFSGTTAQLRLLSMGATFFAVLLIPELWRNHRVQSLEIESAAYFSLRQILAARLLLFAAFDVLTLTLFCLYAAHQQTLPLMMLTVHFLLPLTLTATLCLTALFSRRLHSELAAMALCLPFGGLWSLVVTNDALYQRLTPALWGAALLFALFLFAASVGRALHHCTNLWEESYHGTDNDPSY